MSLPHILLGLLENPASGYDIKQQFNESLIHFWAAELSQIYPALKKLEDQGLLKCSEQPSAKGPAKKLYTRTAQGTQVLLKWLSHGPDMGATRVPYLAQTFFLDNFHDTQKALIFLSQLEHTIELKLARLELTMNEWAACESGFPDSLAEQDFYKYSTLQYGITLWRAKLQWCQACMQRLSTRQPA